VREGWAKLVNITPRLDWGSCYDHWRRLESLGVRWWIPHRTNDGQVGKTGKDRALQLPELPREFDPIRSHKSQTQQRRTFEDRANPALLNDLFVHGTQCPCEKTRIRSRRGPCFDNGSAAVDKGKCHPLANEDRVPAERRTQHSSEKIRKAMYQHVSGLWGWHGTVTDGGDFDDGR
jgi:hypothetical protein